MCLCILIQYNFDLFRHRVIKAKSLVQKIFGPKFHIKFPYARRAETEDCGQGIWPTDSNGMYTTLGVDILARKGEKVVNIADEVCHWGHLFARIVLRY